MKAAYFKFIAHLSNLVDIPLLAIRLTLAYGFYDPAIRKVEHFDGIVEWFTEMGLPLPTLQAYLATGAEVLAFILLPLGLATRFIALPLMITMVVAITMVHWENGFSAGDGGFEIPFYYLLMLSVLFFVGPGRISLDYWIGKWVNKPKPVSKPAQP